MAQVSLRSQEELKTWVVSKDTTRLFFVDHLRAALIILVVLHHVALVYGAGAPFYYAEPPFTSPLTYQALLAFILMNQAWFMGALFLLAGYFTPGSYDRKGAGTFVKERLIRIGIPLLVWIFVLNPIASIGFWQMPPELTGITDPLSWAAYPYLIGLGVAWFLALLLIFDLGYVAWRKLTENRESAATPQLSTPSYLGIGLFVLALAAASYLTRMVIPMGREVLGFPTLSYLPQYLSFFVVGLVAVRRDWLRAIPGSMGATGFVAAVVATVILFPWALSGQLFSMQVAEPAGFVGNGTMQSAIYALWDSIFAVGMTLAAITFFHRFFDEKSAIGTFLAQQSYAVYLIHVPIIVFVAVALAGLDLEPMAKFVTLSLIVVPTCLAAAWLLRKIPGVSRVL